MMRPPSDNLVLAIHPCHDGFGWMVFDGPLSPVDWQVSAVGKKRKGADKNKRSLGRAEQVFEQFQPTVLVLEAFDETSKRHKRIQALCRSIVAAATMRRIGVRIIPRSEIRSCFASTDGTRYAIAKTVAAYLPHIGYLLPRKRKPWESEPEVMALFNAAALLIAHYANPKEPL